MGVLIPTGELYRFYLLIIWNLGLG
jgi:hypothetical protein